MSTEEKEVPAPVRIVLGTLLAVGCIVLMIGGAVLAVIYVLMTNFGLEVSLLWTALVGAIGWLIKTNRDRKHEHQRLLANDKRQRYGEFLEILNHYVTTGLDLHDITHRKRSGQRRAKPQRERITNSDYKMSSLRLKLFASDDVIRHWNLASRPRSDTDEKQSPDDDYKDARRRWADLLLAIRRDCGHDSTMLTHAEILLTFFGKVDAMIDEPDRE